MIVKERVGNVEMSSDIVPSQFKIKANRKAFEILSSGLYSDRCMAVVRELSTNAYDSHVQAGKADVPFYVHLPSSLEPYFSVKDDGIGMSPEQVRSIYTTYFESNKTESNDLVGCLGLGSKSPFSYTDQFTVESRHNGTKILYNCFVDASGVPTIAKLTESPTQECNGVEIKFPVKKDDFWEFSSKASVVLSWFKVRPIVKGDYNFKFIEREHYIVTPQYALLKSGSNYSSNNSHIVMGNVAYPVQRYELESSSSVEFTEIETAILNWGIDLYVDIGKIEITANREKVNYDQKTFNAVKEILVVAVEDIKKEVEVQISAAKTEWEARCALHEIRHSILGRVRNMVNFNWNGITISDNINLYTLWLETAKAKHAELVASDQLDPNIAIKMIDLHWEGSQAQMNYFQTLVPRIILQSLVPNRGDKYRKTTNSTMCADGRTIFLDDLNRGGLSRITNYCREHKLDNAYVLSCISEQVVKNLGIDTIVIRSSTLPKSQAVKGKSSVIRTKSVKATVNEYVGSGLRKSEASTNWQAAEIEADAGGVYVDMLYYKVKNSKGEYCHPYQLHDLKIHLAALGADTAIYGVRPGDIEKIKKHSEDWVSLQEYVESVIENNKGLENDLELAIMLDNFYDSNILTFKSVKLPSNSVMGRYIEKYNKAEIASKNVKIAAYKALNAFCLKILSVDTEKQNELDALRDKAYEKYPLLSRVSWYNKEDAKMMTEYVNMVDSLEIYKNLEKANLDALKGVA